MLHVLAENEFGSRRQVVEIRLNDSEPALYSVKSLWNDISKRNEISIGADLELDCRVSKYEEQKVFWFFNNQVLKREHEKTIIKTAFDQFTKCQILEIRNVTKDDQGRYECKIVKEDGIMRTLFQNIDVIAKAPPVIKTNFGRHLFDGVGDELKLECAIEWISLQNLTWYKDGKLLTSSDRIKIGSRNTSMTISSLEKDDSGNYSCIAINLFGRDQHSIEINVSGRF